MHIHKWTKWTDPYVDQNNYYKKHYQKKTCVICNKIKTREVQGQADWY